MTNQHSIDAPSTRGIFGWERIGEISVPVVVRSNGIRYSPVRVVEQEIIKKYDALPQTVFQCITLKSFYLTPIEAKHLTHINYNHCDRHYGELPFTLRDVIISASDVKELSRYLNLAQTVFNVDLARVSDKIGIIQIIDPLNQSELLTVPYLVKVCETKSSKFVPASVVRNIIKVNRQIVSTRVCDWDIMYLKMLSIYGNLQYIGPETCLLSLDSLVYAVTGQPLIISEHNPMNWRT